MISNDTIQTLWEIVAKMGPDNVCDMPHAFAGAILDTCDANDVKLLTTVLRSHYSTRLMEYFRNGSGDATTWTQQKTFIIDESGMNAENVENVLDALWKAMGWQRPQPSRIESEPVKEIISEAETDNNLKRTDQADRILPGLICLNVCIIRRQGTKRLREAARGIHLN